MDKLSILNPLNFCPRFQLITDQIFQQLDTENLAKCRKVAKPWKKFIDDRNFSWIQVIDIPSTLKCNNSYLHLAAKTGQSKIFQEILEKEVVKNPINKFGITPFHNACRYGHPKVAWILMKDSVKFNIDLNAKDKWGTTPIIWACENGQSKIAEMILLNSAEFSIDINTMGRYFEIAQKCPSQIPSKISRVN